MQTYITERDGLILVVAADGGLNRGTAQQLIEEISKHVEAGATQVVVAGWAGGKHGDGRNFSKPESPPPGVAGSGSPYMWSFLGRTVKNRPINFLLWLLYIAFLIFCFFDLKY